MDSWVGQTLLGRYRVVRPLDAGGMAAVYVAEDVQRPGWELAVKHPLREGDRRSANLSDDDLRTRFRREIAKLIAMGEHRGVVRIEAQGEHEGVPFYVMPLLTGGSLDARLRSGPQAPEEVARWAAQIAGALDWIHGLTPAVLHRDVKPSNILFDRHGEAQLADFGIVKELAAAWGTTGVNTAIGTPGYMALEQLAPDGEVDPRTDQYALAATMYHALTGVAPRYETTAAGGRGHAAGATGGKGGTAGRAVARKRLKPVHEWAPHVPVVACAAVERGLAKEQDARFDTCGELVAAFRAGLSAGTAAAAGGETRHGAPPPAGDPPPARRGPRRGLLLAGLVALLLGGGTFAALGLGGPGAETGAARGAGPATPAPSPAPPATPPSPEPAVLDTTPPTVSVAEPAEETTTTLAPEVILRGTVADGGTPLAGVRLRAGESDVTLHEGGAFSLAVPLAVDEERTVVLVATDAAGNRSAPVTRSVRRDAPWAAALRAALAGLAAEDGEAVRAALASPEAREIPWLRVKDAAEFLARWDEEPTLTVASQASGEAAAGVRPVRVAGTFTTGRKTDRVFLDGADATVPPGRFEAVLRREAAGSVNVPWEIRSGARVRRSGSVPVTFEAAVMLSPPPEPRPPPGDPTPPIPPFQPAWATGLVSDEQKRESVRLRKPVAFEEPTTGMRFVLIPGGTFRMGSPPSEEGRDDDEGPQHEVTLSPFYLGIHEVTNAQYRKKEKAHASWTGFNGDAQPVVSVSHVDATDFVEWLSQQGTVKGFRLPTEAQWEYACRAGTTTPFHVGATISTTQANYDGYFTYGSGAKGEDRRRTVPVGTLPSNRWGLFEMHGNAWEWCADAKRKYTEQAVLDPVGGTRGNTRVLRGGSWNVMPAVIRSAVRSGGVGVSNRSDEFGFRVALPVSAL